MTNDLNKRMEAHFSKSKSGAKYTKSHDALRVEAAWRSKDKSLACKLEAHIKNLNKSEKEKLIIDKKLKYYLSGKVDCRRYTNVDLKKELNAKLR